MQKLIGVGFQKRLSDASSQEEFNGVMMEVISSSAESMEITNFPITSLAPIKFPSEFANIYLWNDGSFLMINVSRNESAMTSGLIVTLQNNLVDQFLGEIKHFLSTLSDSDNIYMGSTTYH